MEEPEDELAQDARDSELDEDMLEKLYRFMTVQNRKKKVADGRQICRLKAASLLSLTQNRVQMTIPGQMQVVMITFDLSSWVFAKESYGRTRKRGLCSFVYTMRHVQKSCQADQSRRTCLQVGRQRSDEANSRSASGRVHEQRLVTD